MSDLDMNFTHDCPPDTQPSDGSLWQPASDERILILAPHPDDEVLAAGGVIASSTARHAASRIRVIIATNGDASYVSALSCGRHTFGQHNFRRLALIRQQESLSALVYLGMSARQIRFWGFPDRGLTPIWESHWDPKRPFRSSTTGFDRSEQPLNSPRLPYTGINLLSLLQREFSEFRPTTIIMPHPQDSHPDHRALARFTMLGNIFYQAHDHLPAPNLLTYMIWQRKFLWINRSRLSDCGVFPTDQLSPTDIERQYLPLPVEIRKQKSLALQCYQSQKLSAFQPLHQCTACAYEAFTPSRPYIPDEMR